MKKCSECNGEMAEKSDKTPEDIEYKYYKCGKCGEEIVDMKQLHNVAEKYRIMKNKIEFEELSKEIEEKFKKEGVKAKDVKDAVRWARKE